MSEIKTTVRKPEQELLADLWVAILESYKGSIRKKGLEFIAQARLERFADQSIADYLYQRQGFTSTRIAEYFAIIDKKIVFQIGR